MQDLPGLLFRGCTHAGIKYSRQPGPIGLIQPIFECRSVVRFVALDQFTDHDIASTFTGGAE